MPSKDGSHPPGLAKLARACGIWVQASRESTGYEVMWTCSAIRREARSRASESDQAAAATIDNEPHMRGLKIRRSGGGLTSKIVVLVDALPARPPARATP